jgi:hypothetical protein
VAYARLAQGLGIGLTIQSRPISTALQKAGRDNVTYFDGVAATLARVRPRLKTPLQLSGAAIIIVGTLAIHFAQPGNNVAMLTVGGVRFWTENADMFSAHTTALILFERASNHRPS